MILCLTHHSIVDSGEQTAIREDTLPVSPTPVTEDVLLIKKLFLEITERVRVVGWCLGAKRFMRLRFFLGSETKAKRYEKTSARF